MSVQTHLSSTASKLILTDKEDTSIDTSITTLKKRLKDYFGDNLKNHFMFGSYTRNTILPRKVDANSDIDYMLVFDNSDGKKPQTFLDRVKRFVESKYNTSERYQSHPTIVLELNHIKFELVPAYKSTWGGYYIPEKGYWGDTWLFTDPVAINKKLTDKNTNNNCLIKPLVRLLKYWNAKAGVYSSFKLEEYIIDRYYWKHNIKDMFYSVVEGLGTSNLSQTNKDKVDRLKRIVAETKRLENNGYSALAETEIKKIIPEYNI